MVWSYKRNRGEIQAKPTLPDRFTAQTLDEAYMSHEKSGPRNYIHEKLHEQIVEKLQAQLTQEREEFKNFHRLICEASNYGHDDIDWKRDQLSLAEHIRTKYKESE